MKYWIGSGLLAFWLLPGSLAQDAEYLVRTFKPHKDGVTTVAFSPDGAYLLTGGEDKALRWYQLGTGELLYEYDNYYTPYALTVTVANSVFLGAGADIKWVDMQNHSLAVYKGNATHIRTIAYAPERSKIAAGSYDYKIKIWNVETTEVELELEGHKKSTLPVAFSPDEKYLVSGSLDKTVKVWNAKTGELMQSLERHTENVVAVAFHPSGRYFVSASQDKTLRLWDFETGNVLMTYAGHDRSVDAVKFLPDGNHLVSASSDGTLRVWQTATGKTVYTYPAHLGAVTAMDISADGHMLLSGGTDGEVKLWELSDKIFVEYRYYDAFHAERDALEIFDARRKGEKKEEYELRMQQAGEKEAEIVRKYLLRYNEELNQRTIK